MTPTPQPKALELAGELEIYVCADSRSGQDTCAEAASELRRQHAEIEALKSLIHDEIDEGLRLRTLGGAGPDENITAMTERVIAERDSLRAEVERLAEDNAKFAKTFATWSERMFDLGCEDDYLNLEVERLTAKVEKLIQAGTMMSHVCFNSKQMDAFPEDWREHFRQAQQRWDDAAREAKG